MMGTKGMRVSIGMVLFILFVVVYMELRQTILMPDRVSVQDFIGKAKYARHREYKPPPFEKDQLFVDVVKKYADVNKTLVVTIVNKNYVSMALNFLKSSAIHLVNNGHSFLLITTDEESHKQLLAKRVSNFYFKEMPTLVFENQTGLQEGHDFGSKHYYVQSNMKTWIVLKIIELGYSVLISDADVVVQKDPFPYYTCANCDIHTQRDRIQFNTGFTYVKPTNMSKLLYQTAWDLYVKYHKSHDQVYINMALGSLKNLNITPAIQYMSQKEFMCGVNYYEYGDHMFANEPCTECVMFHNNYMGTLAGKIYRFKENLQWHINEDEYYSSKTRKYLTYDNPYFFKDDTTAKERKALFTALKIGLATNRTVILPEFHCCDCERPKCENSLVRCSLLNLLRLKKFDSVYAKHYREHMFLANTLVPKNIRSSNPKKILIATKIVQDKDSSIRSVIDSGNYTLFQLQSQTYANFTSLVNFVSKFNEVIVHFHSLYEVLSSGDYEENSAYECGPYQQWDSNIKI